MGRAVAHNVALWTGTLGHIYTAIYTPRSWELELRPAAQLIQPSWALFSIDNPPASPASTLPMFPSANLANERYSNHGRSYGSCGWILGLGFGFVRVGIEHIALPDD